MIGRHRNKISFEVRLELAEAVAQHGMSAAEAATAIGVSEQTARKWFARFLLGGPAALCDAFRLAPKGRLAIGTELAIAVVDLNRRGLRAKQIAEMLGISLVQTRQVLARVSGCDRGRSPPVAIPSQRQWPLR
jgi:transposase